MILSRQCCLVAFVAALTFPLGPHPCPFHSLSLRLCLCLPCLPLPLRLFLNIILSLRITVCRLLWTVSILMQAYRTSRSCEGCGDLCVRLLVCGIRDIGLIASSALELPIRLHNCRSIVTSIILSESGFGDHLGVRANRGDLKAKSANVVTTTSPPPPCPSDEKIWDSHV